MKICPVCNDSFADQLNFCDIDGARLTGEGAAQQKNKWWSLIGAGLLVGALVISAASIFFLPRARVSTPIVNSEPQPSPAVPVVPKPAAAEAAASVTASSASAQPETVPTDAVAPDVRKKDKALANGNFSGAPPNPKAAATAPDDSDRKAPSAEAGGAISPTPKKPEASPSLKSAGDPRPAETATRPQIPPELKKDPKAQTATAKNPDKDSNDKKKTDDKKKGGFLKVFKKIFGKD